LSTESDFIKVNIRQYQRNIRNPQDCEFPTPKTSAKKIEISREKKKDIKAMLKYCPQNDKKYMEKFIN
jgi:hypothetical protein